MLRSFACAGRGIRVLLASQCNARWHLVATLTVVVSGFSFGISRQEWMAVLLCMGLVWSAEALNTAIEWLCDKIEPNHDEQIRNIKDVAAAGVLLASIAAAIVGFLIFLPRLWRW
ncbi:unnamed protein product [uncultured bacterium]|nr:unnamed protein product [uncultured bacterium]